ncbi:MAG: glycosyltransferase family 4 protein [Neorhizobium sp.]|nr:glycosyltransferase family 4 protein [Neorhizobium sp.]
MSKKPTVSGRVDHSAALHVQNSDDVQANARTDAGLPETFLTAGRPALREQPRPAQDIAASPRQSDIIPMPDLIVGRDAVRRRVMMLGLRGIPHIQGGVEKHVEMLAQELSVRGWDVEILARRRYLSDKRKHSWKGIGVTPLPSPRSHVFEAFFHTLLGVLYAALKRPDVLHIHAIGPGLFAPFARLLGLRVVVTHHGFDYDREKWNAFGKAVLRVGERLAMRFSNAAIAVSRDVTGKMKRRYAADVTHIPNGVVVRPSLLARAALETFDLERQRYIVMVARFVPEKRQTDLIAAFSKLHRPGWKLVLVGGADHQGSGYARQVEDMAARVENVVLAGFQSGDTLAALFSQAGLFVLPSLHEGMPIALLEALSYGLPVLASDIAANHEVDLPADDYFPAGDVEALTRALQRKVDTPPGPDQALARIRDIEQNYAWPSICRQTTAVYRAAGAPDPQRTKA